MPAAEEGAGTRGCGGLRTDQAFGIAKRARIEVHIELDMDDHVPDRRAGLALSRPWNTIGPASGGYLPFPRLHLPGTQMTDEVLTIKEVVALMRLAEKPVYAMAQAGELPAFKIRRQWRIKHVEFDRWIDALPRGGVGGGGNDVGR